MPAAECDGSDPPYGRDAVGDENGSTSGGNEAALPMAPIEADVTARVAAAAAAELDGAAFGGEAVAREAATVLSGWRSTWRLILLRSCTAKINMEKKRVNNCPSRPTRQNSHDTFRNATPHSR